MSEWWQEFFRPGRYRLEDAVSEERTEVEASFVWDKLGLAPGMRALDLCCGIGRHARALRSRGASVVGVDITPDYLLKAGGNVVCGDMRRVPLRGSFDAAYNLFSSFGYFEDGADDERTLCEIGRLLRPGGRFLIDVINPFTLARRFMPTGWIEIEDGYLLEKRKFDFRRGRIDGDWTFMRGGSPVTVQSSLRLYTIPEYERMLSAANMSIVEVFSGLQDEPVSFDQMRVAIVAERR